MGHKTDLSYEFSIIIKIRLKHAYNLDLRYTDSCTIPMLIFKRVPIQMHWICIFRIRNSRHQCLNLKRSTIQINIHKSMKRTNRPLDLVFSFYTLEYIPGIDNTVAFRGEGQTSIQCVGGHSLTTFQNTELCLYERKICHKRFACFSSFN